MQWNRRKRKGGREWSAGLERAKRAKRGRGTRTSSGQCLGCPSNGHLARPLLRIVLLSFFPASLKASSTPEPRKAARMDSRREINASSACLNGDTFAQAASHGGKTDLSAPTFLPSCFLAASFPRPRILFVTEFVPDALSLSISLSLSSFFATLDSPLPSHSLVFAYARGSCLTREYFTFPCCRGEKNEGSSRASRGAKGMPTRRIKIRFLP